MKAIILAAGIGKRLYPITEETHKCLIGVGNKTLIKRNLDILKENGIKNVVIVVGHLKEKIKKEVGDEYNGVKVKYIENPSYAKTGSMHSLLYAEKEIDGDFIFMDSDLLIHNDIIKKIVQSEEENAVLFGPLKDDSGEEVKVYVKKDVVTHIGKKVDTNDECLGEAVGIVRYSKGVIQMLKDKMNALFQENPNAEHEDLTQLMCNEKIMKAVSTDNLPWIEIDFKEDIDKARNVIIKEIENA